MMLCACAPAAAAQAGGAARPDRQVTFGASNFEPGTGAAQIEQFFTGAGVAGWAAAGVTSWESYVRWKGVEPLPGQWDFSMYDKEVEALKRNNIKWVPFLIAGPNYTTPWWFLNSADALFYRCLEHGVDSGVQSLFNPAMRPHVEEFIKKFAEHYRADGAVESVLLGITGDYGEAIYPVMDVGHWTGAYHEHPGFWAGDREARASFSRWLSAKYGTVAALNTAWGAPLPSFEAAAPFLPEVKPSDAAWLDMMEWYRESMEEWAEFWISTARTYFPDTPVYLCTGGDGAARHGSRFGRQAKIAAKYGAGVRITNEGSDYAANFTLTHWVASACKFYKTYYGFEPASGVDEHGLVRRVYNVTASGARQLFEYSGNAWSNGWRGGWPELVSKFAPVDSLTPVAVFIPETYLALHPDRLGGFYSTMRFWRDVADYDFVDETMAADGALAGYKVLLMSEGTVVGDAAGAAIAKWTRGGGLLVGKELDKSKLVSGAPLLPDFPVRSVRSLKIKEMAKPYGKGYAASYPAEAAQLMELTRKPDVARSVFFHSCTVAGWYPCLPEADGPADGVFTTLTRDGLLMLNTTDVPFAREVKLHGPTLKRLGIDGAPESVSASVPPQSFVLIKFQ
jgi:hypothetical protein